MGRIDKKILQRPRIVIVGGGFGGLETARRLRKCDADITLIDRNNYHLFQPLLYQVATGGLSPANIAAPLRSLVGRQKNCRVLLAEVQDINRSTNELLLDDGRIGFDYLVVAAGSAHSYFGNKEWERHAPGLKSLPEATEIRRRIYMAFEAAEREKDPVTRRELMTFVIVGGGPTGVELAGALGEIARDTLKCDFREIQPDDAKIIVVEASKNVLGAYPENLSKFAEQKLGQLQIESRTQQKVTAIDDRSVMLESTVEQSDGGSRSRETIRCRTVLWAAGVQANPLGQKIAEEFGLDLEQGAYVPVDRFLRVDGSDNVFVIGDLADVCDENGDSLPKVAPVAIQQGRFVAKFIKNLCERSDPHPKDPKPFRYRDLGSMATIGRAAAIAKIGKLQMRGFIAWVLWLGVHLMQLVQFQNRLLVLIQWGWNYFTFNRSARIITGSLADDDEKHPTPSLTQADRSLPPSLHSPVADSPMTECESHA